MTNDEQQDARLDEAKSYLLRRAGEVDVVLAEFWESKRSEWAGFPGVIQDSFDIYDDLTSGGKKLRAVLAMLGYEACRHSESPPSERADGIQRAAGAIEILHNASLIHDDIIDRSELRRGRATSHRRYAARFRSLFPSVSEAEHYGVALAINLGDQGQALAEQLLLSSGFPERQLLRAVSQLGATTADTVAGQFMDLERVTINDLTKTQVLKIYEFKTARYSVLFPLLVGAILADADPGVIDSIQKYAIPVGNAFQLRDDSIGMFGEEVVTGKAQGDDLREGKKTLLFVYAYGMASEGDKEFLLSVHGNPEATEADLSRVKAIMTETGAKGLTEQVAADLVNRAISAVPEITSAPEPRDKLVRLAEYSVQRRK